jgi:hypothetical protein
MSEQPVAKQRTLPEANDIVEILKKKRVASEKQRKSCLKASIIAAQKRKADKIKLDMLKELEENKIDIHKILDETREKQQNKTQLRSNELLQPIEHTEQIKMELINIQTEPIKLSLKDRLRNALL